MSLLLTFFILLFSVSEVKDNKIYEMIESFRMFFEIEASSAGFHMESFSEIQQMLAELARELPDRSEGSEGKTDKPIENPFGAHVGVAKIADELQLQVEGRVLFEEGSAELRPEARELLIEMRAKLRGFPNRIRCVGHASPLPLSENSVFKDHYDLAYHRAKAVRAVLKGGTEASPGIHQDRISIETRGDADLIPGVDHFDPTQRARLRRVEVIVTPYKAIRS